MDELTKRIIEGYIGEYASGKSENAINRALQLKDQGRKVTLVDLDIVEPFYTLRPLKRELEEAGLNVIAWETGETLGLGETGSLLKPQMIWALKNEGDVILDIGYGVHGARILNLIHGAKESTQLQMIAVLNTKRPMTSTLEDILEYISELGRVDALLNNTHMGDQTTASMIQEGAALVYQAAQILKIEYLGTSAEIRFAQRLGEKDSMGFPIRYLKRFMPKAIW
jgi:hypothetical protein